MNHLWQRFLIASSLIVGLFIGVAATVFGYSNLSSVNVHWSIFHIDGVPLWTVAVVPLALFLVAGTLYHWMDGLHHFTEHMRHRHRVHELEAEVAVLRAHLDQVLEMPDHSTSRLPGRKVSTASLPAADGGITDFGRAEAEPMPVEALLPVTAPPAPKEPLEATVPPQSTVDGPVGGERPSIKKSRPAHRKRVTLEVAGEPRRPDRSGSHVERMIRDGKAAEPGDSLEPET